MAKLGYNFSTPIPRYFSDHGWFDVKNPQYFKTLAFLYWAFGRCNPETRKIFYDHKEIELQPFEFIYGRNKCAEETGLTENEVRTQVKRCEQSGLLKKTPNSVPNRFTCYKWVLTRFSENSYQVNPQPIPNQEPTDTHKRDYKTDRQLDIEDESLEDCGNVYESSLTRNGPLPKKFPDDLLKLFAEYKFENNLSINPKVLFRWAKEYKLEDIYHSLQYYETRVRTVEIENPEAYVEKTLQERYWEDRGVRAKRQERESWNKNNS